MSYQTEQQLEDGFIKRLVKNEYERILIKDTDALADNFRKQMNRMNAEGLKGQELSDKEFERLLLLIEGKSVFESAKILRQKKDMVRDDGSIIYIQFFNPQRGDKNHFQVTNQVTAIGRYTNRYDVTLLVNGLPVVQIGLKRRGLHFNESYNQILRYRKDSYGGLYNFLQLFIVTGSGRIINNTGYMNQKSRKNKFSKDMVLFGKLRLYLKKYWFTECEGMCSTEIWVLTTLNPDFQNKFLYYYIQTEAFMEYANISSGSKMPRADWSTISDIVIHLPFKEEQEKIIAFLTGLDSKILVGKEKVELLREQKKGFMQRMFV